MRSDTIMTRTAGSTSLRSTAKLGSAGCSSGLTALLPSLSCPDPALAERLLPDPLSLCIGHHPGAARQ